MERRLAARTRSVVKQGDEVLSGDTASRLRKHVKISVRVLAIRGIPTGAWQGVR